VQENFPHSMEMIPRPPPSGCLPGLRPDG